VILLEILLGLSACFGAGLWIGYRWGVVSGYDRAEEMLSQITTEQYQKLKGGNP
jgi:hypothetical protein